MPHHSVTISAHAKINLTLEVLGKRPDGYHDIASVIQAIALADTVALTPAKELDFTCDVPGLDDDSNLALLAARLLQKEAGVESGAFITLKKRIPEAAGLGGGSSDASAVLRGLNALWGLGLTQKELQGLGAQLGSDVPYFILGGTVLVEGRGERLTCLPALQERWLVLLAPALRIKNKTAAMYSRIATNNYSSGLATRQLAGIVRRGGGVESSHMFNAFEQVADEVFPGLEGYRKRFREAGATSVHLSGAGPSVYSFVEGQAEGRSVQEALAFHGIDALVTRTTESNPPMELPA